jgi:hypothetical protein
MKGIEELAALARQDISERGALSSTEGFPYPQNLLCPLQNLQAPGLHQIDGINGWEKFKLFFAG